MKFIAVASIAACVFNLALGSAHLRINPELDPTSDHKFFKKDYPDDSRPEPYHQFGHPYPTIQDSDRYDKDYVKDENDDGGYWKAQMEYDALQNKLAKEKAELAKAIAKAAQEKKEMDKAYQDWLDAQRKAKEATIKEKAADSKHDTAHADLEQLKKDIANSADKVEEEVKDLEDCKNKLIEAKAKLKKLMGHQAEAEKKEAERQSHEDNLEVIEKEKEKIEAEKEKSVVEEKKEHEVAASKVAKEKEDVRIAEEELRIAYEKLKKWRRADPDGGVYEVKKSGATYAGVKLAFPVLLAALVTASQIF